MGITQTQNYYFFKMPRKDSSNQKRKRGKDKRRERYEKNGKYIGKGLRAWERIQEANADDARASPGSLSDVFWRIENSAWKMSL